MSTIRFVINVPVDKALAIDSVLKQHGISMEYATESEAVDSDPTPPHGVPRDGVVFTHGRYRELIQAETQRDQLLGEVVKLRNRVEEMREQLAQLTVAETHRNQLLGEVVKLRGRVEEMRESNSDIRRERDALREVVKLQRRLSEQQAARSIDDRMNRFHRSVAAAYTWLEHESSHAGSVPEALDAAVTFIDAVREAIDEYAGKEVSDDE